MGRAQLKTDHLNQRSQAAIEGIGMRCEGVLCRDRRCSGGMWRDTVCFSVLAGEWSVAMERLVVRLGVS